MEYLLFKEIRTEMENHYHRYGHGLTFRDTVSKLQQQQRTHSGVPVYPDFLEWNTADLDELVVYAGQIPIFIEEIFRTKENYTPEQNEYALSENLTVQIALEAIYAPSRFQVLPFINITYILKGSAVFYTKEAHYTLTPGTLLLVSPYYPFYIHCSPEDIVLQIGTLATSFDMQMSQIIAKNELLSVFFRRTLKQKQKDFLHFVLPPNQQVLEIIKHLFVEFLSKELFSEEVFLDYLQILYAHILRNCSTDRAYIDRAFEVPVTIFPAISFYIQKNYQTVTLTSLAGHFNYSPAYLSRLIKKETGKNLSDILSELKLKEAKRLLSGTNFSITEIAERSGFQSANHFTHSFKKKTGMSPKEYRRGTAKEQKVK